jgi:hypothetical protein
MRKLMTLLFILALSIQLRCEIYLHAELRRLDLFHPEIDTTTLENINDVILQKADSVKVSLSEGHLDADENCITLTSFSDLPCIHLFFLTQKMFIIGYPLDKYQVGLFNDCDSSMYRLGGDIKDYSKVMEQYIDPSKFQDLLMMRNLINLYLCMISFYDQRTILNTYADFENLYNDKRLLLPGGEKWEIYSIKQAKKENNLVKQIFNNIQYSYTNDSCRINLCSWSTYGGELEYWEFLFTKGNIEILNHIILLESIGPYRGRIPH